MKNLSLSILESINNDEGLKEKIAVYIPSTKNIDTPIDNTPYVKQAIKLLSQLFGGATAQDSIGGWYSDTINQIVSEKVTIVYAYTNDMTDNDKLKVIDYALQLKNELTQDSISLEINDQLFFI